MNIVVIGSCTDSSILASDLNRRLKNSIVARVDLLKNIKQLVLSDLNVKTEENLGKYIGDVESYDFSKLTIPQKKSALNAINAIDESLAIIKPSGLNKSFEGLGVVNTFDALTYGIPTSTYSFVKIYSGIINDSYLSKISNDSNFLQNTIIVYVKKPSEVFIPIKVSDKIIDTVKSKSFAFIECDIINDIYKSELFQTLFELTKEKEKPVEKKEKEPHLSTDVFRIFGTEPVPVEEEEALDMAA